MSFSTEVGLGQRYIVLDGVGNPTNLFYKIFLILGPFTTSGIVWAKKFKYSSQLWQHAKRKKRNKKCGRPIWWHRYNILFPELIRGRDETYRRCELVTLTFDLETGAQCSTCRHDLYATAAARDRRCDRMTVGGARRHRYRSIDQQQTAAA